MTMRNFSSLPICCIVSVAFSRVTDVAQRVEANDLVMTGRVRVRYQ